MLLKSLASLPSAAGTMAALSSRSRSFSGGIQLSRAGSVRGLASSQAISNVYGGTGIMTGFSLPAMDGPVWRCVQSAVETSILDMNEKDTMQNLNGRLSAYLDRVSIGPCVAVVKAVEVRSGT